MYDEMWFPTINSQSKINVVKGISKYAVPGQNGVVGYILATGKSHLVVTSYGDTIKDPVARLGHTIELVSQGGNNDRTYYRTLVGYVNDRGEKFGVVPDRLLPHYVMK